MKKIFILFSFLLLHVLAFAQNQNALLWKISGNGIEKPSYIFGTMHAICEEDYFFPDYVDQAFHATNAFFAEIDFSDTMSLLAVQELMKTEVPLKERMTAEEYENLEKLLDEKLNVAISKFEFNSFSMILSTITIKSFHCPGKVKTYELELFQKALMSQKQLGGLESVQEQFEILEKSITAQTIIKTLEQSDASETSEKLVSLFKKQDIDALEETMNEFNPDQKEELLTNRNVRWAKEIPTIISKGPTFFGVGAAHLGGEMGVLQLLRKQGFVVEPITSSKTTKKQPKNIGNQ